MDISLLDIGLGVVLLLFLIRGFLRGLIKETAGLIGLVLGLGIAGALYGELEPYIAPYLGKAASWSGGISYIAIFIIVNLVCALAAALLRKVVTVSMINWVDITLGGIVGLGKGLIFCSIAVSILARFVPQSPFLESSVLVDHGGPIIELIRSYFPSFLQ